jgi:hypothetical protein
MSTKRAVDGPPTRRPPSQGRLKAFIQRSDTEPGPSTLPPPPFESEAQVLGLEWWLGAHMNLASSLLWLEQHHGDTVPPSSQRVEGHHEAMRQMVARTAAVRDALYELYCDAADPRLEVLASNGGPLEVRVRRSYLWCERVVALLGGLSAAMRAGTPLDLAEAKSTYREIDSLYPGLGGDLRAAVDKLGVDFTSPIEPLRGLPHDINTLIGATDDLHTTLGARFT